MPDLTRPTITDDHKKKYEEIMGTPVKSASQPPPAPKPKGLGLGNKMFIFTGKKKIVLEGTQREVEKVKTVNPEPAEKPMEKPTEKKSVFDTKPEELEKKPGKKSKVPMIFLIFAGVIFIGVYTFFFLVLFGFVKL